MDEEDKQIDACEDADKTVTPEWARWKGDGPAPARWWAINPDTNERTIIYRSYADYCA